MANTSSQPHSRLIQQAAKEVLSPLDIFQKGRSRIWLDDHGWWLVVIEFQPSSWSKGSYLNAGAMWLWSEQDYFSFDAGSRVEHFVRYESQTQFEPEARRLALSAREQALKFRKQLPSIAAAARFLKKQTSWSNDPWRFFHAGVALGYVGQSRAARACFDKLTRQEPERDWEKALHAKARELAELLSDPLGFRSRVVEAIRATRKLLKLPDNPDPRIA